MGKGEMERQGEEKGELAPGARWSIGPANCVHR